MHLPDRRSTVPLFDGDYDAYERSLRGELRDLPRIRARAFGWGVCEQLLQVIVEIDRAADLAMLERLKDVLEVAWATASDEVPPIFDIASLEELVPQDASGAALGGDGIDELSDLGMCVALVSDSRADLAGPVSRAATAAVSALGNYGDCDVELSREQDQLIEIARDIAAPLAQLKDQAVRGGAVIGRMVSSFVAS